MTSVFSECKVGRWRIAVKGVNIFGYDTMTIAGNREVARGVEIG